MLMIKFKNSFINDKYNENIFICKGAKIMLLCNIEVNIGLVNGTLGTVKEITNDCILIEYFFNNKNYYAMITRNNNNNNHLILKQSITRKQFPIVLAYCITCHKLQGQTINNLIIHCSNLKGDGVFYSVLSRLKNSKNLHIKSLNVSKSITNNKEINDLILSKLNEFNNNEYIYNKIYDIFQNNMENILINLKEYHFSIKYIQNFHIKINDVKFSRLTMNLDENNATLIESMNLIQFCASYFKHQMDKLMPINPYLIYQ